ncbi:hypothetical protein HBI56_014870 [Parastagonospora nodorum]|uniref:Peptidase M43 pregnancy-associated plasma-A domain-containing protein n=2 Tax=Phaeosphaeria nodorum (strain SN15 / ATCC MYA-4574 / FGSC 10173) TaxID=321614 RepID=A0A7U2F197_PHANO|nr:hypothetical protein HBH56_085110 [Parastagonospora nodorum]QRC96866.1 hypothetical protein JI435_017530 [Parastagonospora nodorum SN15]KAH3930089.1 hypothetical protein HBH54_116730 [Parastagonospora nodorum]KAH3955648.1 hypothetical protein HBH53_007860 [Parastagonospora nodorum]KAH3976814.1 hypothetical protein HBH51_073660 [Parastagonospora nodorum]
MCPRLVQLPQNQFCIRIQNIRFASSKTSYEAPCSIYLPFFTLLSLPAAMFTHILLASLGLLASATKSFDCGTDTKHASDEFLQTIQALHGGSKGGSPAARAALAARDEPSGPIKIDAVFHIVATSAKKSTITNSMPSAQIDALNEAYKPHDITFNLINVTWTTNDDWAVGDKPADDAMKKALRQGSYDTLNIYFQTDLMGGVLGRCTLPSSMAQNKADPSVYYNDGCNVNANTMPQGSMNGYNAGKTAVHETGHWMGLLHTFEGGSCDGPGDYIDDTPAEKTATDGCPTSPAKRTCPDQQKDGESDPIHNYMDYSIDSCYEGFTDLQVARMRNMWGMYRNGN